MVARRFRRTLVSACVLTSAVVVLPRGATSQTAFAPGQSCQTVEHRQFDFWIGHWDVFVPSGKKAGQNRIEVIADRDRGDRRVKVTEGLFTFVALDEENRPRPVKQS